MMQRIEAFFSCKIHKYIIAHEPVGPVIITDLKDHGARSIACGMDLRHLLCNCPLYPDNVPKTVGLQELKYKNFYNSMVS